MKVTGKCLCEQVRYQINGPLHNASHCHCSMCRRQHGSAFATYASVTPSNFTWLSGSELVECYETANGGGWCFCRVCGATLAGMDNGQITSITLGTVEGDPGITPQYHIFVDSKASWYTISDKLVQYSQRKPGTPSDH